VVAPVSLIADKLALDIYNHAQATGEPITLGMVERRFAELCSHEPGCACGLCAAAATVRPLGVYRIASVWQGSIAATRRRAVR
jgi:hypothetical protein